MSRPSAESPIPVRWADADPLGHVTNGVLLNYLDEARDQFLAATLPDFARTDYVVARIELDFRHPVTLQDRFVRGSVAVRACGRTSLAFDERLSVEGSTQAVAVAVTTVVFWDQAAGCPRAVSKRERALLLGQAGTMREGHLCPTRAPHPPSS